MAVDPKTPLTFFLPDNDVVSLVTWEYISAKLADALNPIVGSIESTNEALKTIDTKLAGLMAEE